MVHKHPEQELIAREMQEKLGNCKTCRFAAVTLDRCERGKKGMADFYHRFDRQCQYHEHDHNWCN